MPVPTREDRLAARDKNLKHQQKRNAEAWKFNKFAEPDPAAVKAARDERQKAQKARAEAKPKSSRPGSSRTVPKSSQAK